MRQRKRKFSFFWLTVSLVLSSNCPAFHQEMVAGGLEPTAWHATSYSLPALNDKFSPTRRTSNIFTTKKKNEKNKERKTERDTETEKEGDADKKGKERARERMIRGIRLGLKVW